MYPTLPDKCQNVSVKLNILSLSLIFGKTAVLLSVYKSFYRLMTNLLLLSNFEICSAKIILVMTCKL